MAVRIEDLPPWAQAQAQREDGAAAAAKGDATPLPRHPGRAGGEKYHNVRTQRTLEDGGQGGL